MKYLILILASMTFVACGKSDRTLTKKVLTATNSKPTVEVKKDMFLGKNYFYVDKSSYFEIIELKEDATGVIGTYTTDLGTIAVRAIISSDNRTYTLLPATKLVKNTTNNSITVLKEVTIQIDNSIKVVKKWETTAGEDRLSSIAEEPIDNVKYGQKLMATHKLAKDDTLVVPFGKSNLLIKLSEATQGLVVDKVGQAVSDKFKWNLAENDSQLNLEFENGKKIAYLKLSDKEFAVAVLNEGALTISQIVKAVKQEALTEKSVVGEYIVASSQSKTYAFDEDGVGGTNGKALWSWSLSTKRDAILTQMYIMTDKDGKYSNALANTKEDILKCIKDNKCFTTQERSYRILQSSNDDLMVFKTVTDFQVNYEDGKLKPIVSYSSSIELLTKK